jgi:adenosylcobyric acid synthase
MTAKALMVWGCTSDAGKSFLTAALCRWFSDQGLRVAPFKAQNMSNNARVARGGEMGCAQWFQAKAARCEPEVRHNPILLKPECDTKSQVVVMGEVDRELSGMDWRGRSLLLWDRAKPALRELMSENDIVVIEGAGSPAEINLADVDYVNLMTAREANAECLLVSDIDRGGSFAHLYGTWAMLPDDLKPRLRGFVLNKFRGDASLLEPGPTELFRRTGVPLLGVIPRVHHDLPDEDAVALDHFSTSGWDAATHRIALVAWPRISNFDEFRRLAAWPGVALRVARSSSDLEGATLVLLPGSKNVPSDLQWLRDRGLDRSVTDFARADKPILGICGGLQALGKRIEDEEGVEGAAIGLGLLPLVTVHGANKIVRNGSIQAPRLGGFWEGLSGRILSGYEIRTGTTRGTESSSQGGLVATSGNIFGTYLHGAFEDPTVLEAVFGPGEGADDPLERTFKNMADLVEKYLDTKAIRSWLAEPATIPVPLALANGRLCVLTGGVRAGKSSAAQNLALEWGRQNVSVIATAQGLDDEMRLRIANHQNDRPPGWETIEETTDIAGALRNAAHRTVVLDCANLWVTNLLLSPDPVDFRQSTRDLILAWRETGKDLIVVTNEVGWGIVPDNALSREFRDQLGWVNQQLVAASTEAWLCVSGAALSLKKAT